MRFLTESTNTIQGAVEALSAHFDPPEAVRLNGVPAFRHTRQHDLLMSYLKCVRGTSLLRSGAILLSYGFYQEVGIVCRCLSEAVEDVLFLATPLGENNTCSKHQTQLVQEFYQEEFEDLSKPADGNIARHRVPREQVLAGIARMKGNPLNTNDSNAFQKMLHRSFSGYVHGAYIHTMELFGAPPNEEGTPDVARGKFYLSGRMPGQRLDEMLDALKARAELLAVAATIVAKRVNDPVIVDRLAPVIEMLAKATGSNVGDVNAAAKAVKAGKPLI